MNKFIKDMIEDRKDVLYLALLSIILYTILWNSVFIYTTGFIFLYGLYRIRDMNGFASMMDRIGTMLLLVIVILVMVLAISANIETTSEKIVISKISKNLKDYKFINDNKIILNYSVPSDIKIIKLNELNWYKLQVKECIPQKVIREYKQYEITSVRHRWKETKYECKI